MNLNRVLVVRVCTTTVVRLYSLYYHFIPTSRHFPPASLNFLKSELHLGNRKKKYLLGSRLALSSRLEASPVDPPGPSPAVLGLTTGPARSCVAYQNYHHDNPSILLNILWSNQVRILSVQIVVASFSLGEVDRKHISICGLQELILYS
jgi:hypothetical protein